MNKTADESRRLCVHCVGDAFLRAEITRTGQDGTFFYCEGQSKTITIGEIADRFKFALDQHFYRTAEEPSGLNYILMKESDFDWEREGESLVDVIENYVEVKPVIATDIQSVLEECYCDFELAQMGAEQPFGKDAQYAERDVDDS